jgi:anti-sigma-K factor RskA
MSSRVPNIDCPQCADAAPYVLGALEAEELRHYREHLPSCATCRAEVAELQVVVDELPASATPVLASAELRGRILTTVRSEAELLRAAGHQADRPARPASRRHPRRRLSLVFAGVALAAVVAIALAIVAGGGSSTHEQVLQAHVTIRGAHASLRERAGRAVLTVSGMPQPALGRIYQVWLSRGPGDAQPTKALFGVTSRGSGAVAVPNSLRGVKEVMVTSEPLGGSSRPTSSPLIRVVLSA